MKLKALLFAFLVASVTVSAADKLTLDQLKVQAESAHEGKQVDLYTEVARQQMELANQSYDVGNSEKALSLIKESVDSAEKAADEAMRSGKKLKQAEIALRKLSARGQDIRRSVAFEDRAPIEPLLARIEQSRTKLLDRMFQKK